MSDVYRGDLVTDIDAAVAATGGPIWTPNEGREFMEIPTIDKPDYNILRDVSMGPDPRQNAAGNRRNQNVSDGRGGRTEDAE